MSKWTAKAAQAVEDQFYSLGIYYVYEFGGVRAGDKVGIAREPGIFTFKSVRLDGDGMPMYVNVWGGLEGYGQFRSFSVDRLTAVPKKVRRRKTKVAS